MRLRHLAITTEQSYCSWLARYARFVSEQCDGDQKPEQKMEAFLTQLARQDVSASECFHHVTISVVPRSLVTIFLLRFHQVHHSVPHQCFDHFATYLASVKLRLDYFLKDRTSAAISS